MTLGPETAVADVADVLYVDVDDLDHRIDLREQGMDSVRIMQLVERWRSAGIPGIDFITLAEDRRLERWIAVLTELQRGGTTAD